MKKHEKRLLIAAGIAVAGAVGVAAASYHLSKKLVKIALDRSVAKDTPENEKKKNQIRGFSDPQDYLDAISEGKAYLAKAKTETFTIESYDGTPLTSGQIAIMAGGLMPGDTIDSYVVEGSRTNVGRSENVITSLVIRNSAGEDVTRNYSIETVAGTLKVTAP